MKLLVLSSRPPWPPTRADQMTVDRLIRFLAARGFAVDLACFVESETEERALRQGLGGVCRRIDVVRLPRWRSYASTAASLPGADPMQVAYFRSGAMRRLVAGRVAEGGHDLVYTHLIRMAEYSRRLPLPKVLGVQISQALNLQRVVEHASDPLRRFFYQVETRKVRPYEARVCADYDRVFLCGPRDVEEIARSAPLPNAVICPHGQDVPPRERLREAKREPGAIVFSGVMATYTNVNAATWFAREIFPRIEQRRPDASLWIVGRSPQRAVQALARPPRVVVTGEVPDVAEWLLRAEVAVDPLRIGAGMQNKLIQAMGCELPVVATTVANEGIGATPDEQLVLRDDPAAFADAVLGLLGDAAARARMGQAARRFVEASWTWEAHFERMLEVLRQVAAPARKSFSPSAT
jgi:sugar transferase (PEP-CTERM/EpsH1 system associated)